jgi:hypothetical protein
MPPKSSQRLRRKGRRKAHLLTAEEVERFFEAFEEGVSGDATQPNSNPDANEDKNHTPEESESP